MNQLDIFTSAPKRCAKAAVLAAMSGHEHMRDLAILIKLWHDYTWEEVDEAIKALLVDGDVVISGEWKPQVPYPAHYRENLYSIAGWLNEPKGAA